MFSVVGTIRGSDKLRGVEWDNGTLTGDRLACFVLTQESEARRGVPVGPDEGPYTFRDHLRDPLSALMLMRELFSDDAQFSGDVPVRPDIPEGAIG